MFQWAGYGIPPMKNDSNQKRSNLSEEISVSSTNTTTNYTNKYLHKKFKKVVDFHSSDCESSIDHHSFRSHIRNVNNTDNGNDIVVEIGDSHDLPISASIPVQDEYKFNEKENTVQSSPPLTSLYKPKFHKASVYIKNDDNASLFSIMESPPSLANNLEPLLKVAITPTATQTVPSGSSFFNNSCVSESESKIETLSNGTRVSRFSIPIVQSEPDIPSLSVPAFPTVTTDLELQPSTPTVNYKFTTLPSPSVILKPKSARMNDGSMTIPHSEVLPFGHGMPVVQSLGEPLLQYDNKNFVGSLKRKSEDIRPLNDTISVNYGQEINLSSPKNLGQIKTEDSVCLSKANGLQRNESTDEYTCVRGKDPKYQLEREVARSLLSLSRMCHQAIPKQCADTGMVTLNTSPNTYPHNFSSNQHLLTSTVTLHKPSEIQEKGIAFADISKEMQSGPSVNQMAEPQNNERFYYDPTADKNATPLETIGGNSFIERTKVEIPFRSNNNNSKENLVTESKDSTSVIMSVGSSNFNSITNVSKKLKTEFSSPCSGPLTNVLENGQTKCGVCHKIFNKPSQLKLHVNIHYFEQPFRCDSCAVSFRTKGHLHKHLGSNSHLNKLSMNAAANGQTSTNNPRPFKCDDCNIGFRIHGHLAKHLRSKMHITKLECLGKLPFGTYAEMERCGINMNDIDTTDCENSLQSLQKIAIDVIGLAM